MSRPSTTALMAKTIRLLVQQPCSATDAARALRCHHDSPRTHMRALHAEGLVHIGGWTVSATAHEAPIYHWGSGTDVPRPDGSYAPVSRQKVYRRVSSVFHLGDHL